MKCLIEKDISTAKKTMILIFSYYKMIMKFCHNEMPKSEPVISYNNSPLPANLSLIPIKEEKVYLQDALMNHPLWKTMDFWECAILESIKDELKNQEKYLIHQNITDIEKMEQYKSIIFGQLAAYSHNMLMFNIEKKLVEDMIVKFSKNHNLSQDKIQEIQVNFLLSILKTSFYKEFDKRI